jgi:hypothetical protein
MDDRQKLDAILEDLQKIKDKLGCEEDSRLKIWRDSQRRVELERARQRAATAGRDADKS